MNTGWTKLRKKHWYKLGGFSNPWLCRKQTKNRGWTYWMYN